MTEADPGMRGVEGERDVPIVHRARSLQSRLSSLLAAGLMVLLGVGSLTWYYTSALARQARAREAMRAATARPTQGDTPPPPLGQVDPPAPAVEPAPRSPAPRALDERLVAALAPQPSSTPAGSPQAETPAQLALERELSGPVFAREPPTSAESSPPAPIPLTPDATGVLTPQGSLSPRAGTGGTDDWGGLLRPTPTSAVQARVLPTLRFLLPKGAFIDCTLETAIDSTLPGMTTCVTATDTFGADGKVVLLERGTKLVGETRGEVSQGMARIFVLWTEARTPEGIVVPLDSPGTDELGRSGLPGHVDRHFWERFGAAMLISLLDVGVQAGVQSTDRGNGTVIYNPTESEGVSTEALKGTINIPPTLLKRNGDRIQVLVARDLDFRSVYELRTRGH